MFPLATLAQVAGFRPFGWDKLPCFATAPIASPHTASRLSLQVLQSVSLVQGTKGALFWRVDPKGGVGSLQHLDIKTKAPFPPDMTRALGSVSH